MATGYTATKYIAEFRVSDPDRAARLLGLCSTVAAVTGLAAAILTIAASSWFARTAFGDTSLSLPLRVAAAAIAPAVLNAFMMGALAGLESYPALGKVGGLSGGFYVIACVIGAALQGVPGAVAGLAVSAVVQALLLGQVLAVEAARHKLWFQFSGMKQETDVLLRFALPASLSGFVSLPAIWLANAILVNHQGGFTQMALFAVANNYRVAALVLPSLINGVGLSLLNNQRGVGDARRFRRVYWVNLGAVLGLVVLAAGGITLFGPWLLSVFGQGFGDGYVVLVVLMGATVLEMTAIATVQPLQSQS